MSKNMQNKSFKAIINSAQSFLNFNASTLFMMRWILIGSIIGILIGSASALFLVALEWATNYREQHIWLIGLLPIGGLLIGLLYHYYGKNVEAGNNLIIDNIHEPCERISIKMAPFVFFSTILTHLLGGSVGREGTALQIAASIADQFTKWFKLTKDDRKILLISAVAGGFGSVFGTPLAGAFFALEFYFIGKINYKALFPAFYTAIFADLITKSFHIPHTYYTIGLVPTLTVLHIFYALLAGLVFGLCSFTFSRLMRFVGNIYKTKISFPPLRPFVGGLIVVLIVLGLGTTKYIGLGIPTIVEAFQHQLPSYDFAIKLLLTVITLAAGFKGGEVTPLFFIGATLGNALGLIIPLPTGLLAAMGFVAVFAGATNTPIACIIMAGELFGIEGITYVAIACITAYYTSSHSSIYTAQKIGTVKNKTLEKDIDQRINEL